MSGEEMTYTMQVLTYGLTFGTLAAVLLYSMTNDATYFSFLGIPLALGLAIGSYLDSRKKEAD